METYKEMSIRHQDEFAALPKFFAFSNEQFVEGLIELDANKDDLMRGAAGCYHKRSDLPIFNTLIVRHNKESEQANANDEFLIGAIAYELSNHEFGYTHNPDDALGAVGISLDTEREIDCYKKARKIALEDYAACN